MCLTCMRQHLSTCGLRPAAHSISPCHHQALTAQPPPLLPLPQVQPEHWVQPSEPRNAEEAHRELVAGCGIITLSPAKGTLRRRGDSCRVTLRYRPSHEGHHSLPLFLKVSDGRCVRLQLSGSTTEAAGHSLGLPPGQKQLVLQPVVLGELDSPVQSFLLHNNWSQAVRIELDTSPLHRLAAQSWGFEVLRCVGDTEAGEVPPGGAHCLQFVFVPLEAKQYTAELPVRLVDTDTVDFLTVVATGVEPAAAPRQGLLPAMPSAVTLVAPAAAAAGAAAGAAVEGQAGNQEPWRVWTGFSSSPAGRLPCWHSGDGAALGCTAAAAPAGMALTGFSTGRSGNTSGSSARSGSSSSTQGLVSLSSEVLSLGTCLAGGLTSRLVVVTNVSTWPVAFAWESRPGSVAVRALPAGLSRGGPGCEEVQDCIEVLPSSGRWAHEGIRAVSSCGALCVTACLLHQAARCRR
jgi:hypothetical protein